MVEEVSRLAYYQIRATVLVHDVSGTHEGGVILPNCWLPQVYLLSTASFRVLSVQRRTAPKADGLLLKGRAKRGAFAFLVYLSFPHRHARSCGTFMSLVDRRGRLD